MTVPVPPDDLAGRLALHLRSQPALLPAGSRIVVALSGGPDSTALLALLHGMAPAFGWHLRAAHFDHAIRPGGEVRAEMLRGRVEARGIEFLAGRPDGTLEASHEAMRRARYAWLHSTARTVRADRIATGHQKDDQAETVLFRILRGTGNRGLAGIPARRGIVVRPLLLFSRGELARWLEEAGVVAFDDPSNRDLRYARTRVRHHLLPALEQLGVNSVDHLVAIGEKAGEVRRLTDRVADLVLADFEAGEVEAWPIDLRAEALRLGARRRGVRLREGAARAAAEKMPALTSGHGLDLGGGLRLERRFDTWRIRQPSEAPPPDMPLEIPTPGDGTGTVRLGGRVFDVRWSVGAPRRSDGTRVALHVHRDHYPLSIRASSVGDAIDLAGGSKKLGRLMSEARVSTDRRQATPVLRDRNGRVLAVLAPELVHRIDRRATGNANLTIEVQDA